MKLPFQDVVFKLWYKYLQITGNAFTGSPEGQIPTKAAVFYFRDSELLGKNTRKRGQHVTKGDENDDGSDDELELCSHFSDEEFYEGLFFYIPSISCFLTLRHALLF